MNIDKISNVSICPFGLGPFVTADKLTLRPGDLVEIDRKIYVHWAIAAGKGEVVHLRCEDLTLNEDLTVAKVEKCRLTDIAGDSLVRINNKQVPARRRGVVPIKWKKISLVLNRVIGTNVQYNCLSRNSEHFVTELKFGVPWSDQTTAALKSLTLLSTSPSTKKALHEAHTTITRNINTLLKRQSSTGSI